MKCQLFVSQLRKKNSQEKYINKQKKVRLHILKDYKKRHFISKREMKDLNLIIIYILIENILGSSIFKEQLKINQKNKQSITFIKIMAYRVKEIINSS